MKFYDKTWNVVYSIGIKCNMIDILTKSNLRYFSSPWDSMESVYGIVSMTDVMVNNISEYYTQKYWDVGCYAVGRSPQKYMYNTEVNTNNTINGELVYPHLDYSWIKETISQQEYTDWINNKSTTSQNKIISSILKVFERRHERMNALLQSKNKVLFIRCDSVDRIRNQKTAHSKSDYSNLDSFENILNFYNSVKTKYPNSNFSLLYYYSDFDNIQRNLEYMSENIVIKKIPDYLQTEKEYIIDDLKQVKVLPRDELESYGLE